MRCKHQLAAYKLCAPMKMIDNEENFNNVLKYWAVNESQSPELTQLAKDFFTIPATSVLSERIWSRAARVIRVKGPQLNPKVMPWMMFAQENSKVICEHLKVLQLNVQLPECYLPPPVNDVDKARNPIDVGQMTMILNKICN
jgi:hypothetical protein